ncbi:unnamed protein product [Lymnaea stagnalis]|uniref:Uncharacterized protein n=1 Tax=Lymnaea stagnalis TaxID=6523 RepID=A0AAV2HH22_LYMST
MATGTRLMQEISDQFLNCKICFENFREPKTLSCLHTFCCTCLQQQYDQETLNRTSRYSIYNRQVTCPLCRKKTDLPTGGVRRLPENFLVSNLTEVVAKRTVSKVPPCEICFSVRAKNVDACSKCLDCTKLLCKGCVDLHLATKVTQQHSLIDLEGEKDIQCKVHPDENVRFYCEPCDACICVVCAFQEHKDHEVCSFSDGSVKYRSSLEGLLGKCKERLGHVSSRLHMIDKYETAVKDVRETIRDLAISYIAQVRAKEKELMKHIDTLYGGEIKTFIDQKPQLQENLDELQSTCNLTDIMLKDKGVELLLIKKEIESKMVQLLEPTLSDMPSDPKYDVRFVPGDVALGRLSFGLGMNEADDDKEERCLINKGRLEGSKLINGCSTMSASNDPDVITNCTQTERCRMKDETTSMFSDMKAAPRHSVTQTDQQGCVSRDTSTSLVQTRERGVLAFVYDVKAKGTMTERSDVRSLKCQTDRSGFAEGEMAGVADDVDVAVKNDVLSSQKRPSTDQATKGSGRQVNSNSVHSANPNPRADIAPVPDLLPSNESTSSYTYTPGRRIRSIKIQTEISALDIRASTPPTDQQFILSMAQAEMKPDKAKQGNVPAPEAPSLRERLRRARGAETETPRAQDVGSSTVTLASRDMNPASVSSDLTTRQRRHAAQLMHSGTTTERGALVEKSTSTASVTVTDKDTSTPAVTQETKVTWTEKPSTSDRATCTVGVKMQDRATGTLAVKASDFGSQVSPQANVVSTNTPVIYHNDHECQTSMETTDQGTAPDSDIESSFLKKEIMSTLSVALDSSADFVTPPQSPVKSPVKLCDKASDPIKTPSLSKATETVKVKSVTSSTETTAVKHVDKDTATLVSKTIDQWTETLSPQMVSTGVTPPVPSTIDVGVATTLVLTDDQATCTDIKAYRDSHTETVIVVCDNETLTDAKTYSDAQTAVEIQTENQECETFKMDNADEYSMTDNCTSWDDESTENPRTQSDAPVLCNSETNTRRPRRRAREIQTSPVPCPFCGNMNPIGERTEGGNISSPPDHTLPNRAFKDSCTEPQLLGTQDVGTMAISCVTCHHEFQEAAIQTSEPQLYDKASAASFDLDQDFLERALSRQYHDAATSTESLPYIGLLSEIDVDELIVVPEAAFELVSDTDSEYDHYDVIMVDDETSTDFLQYVESGTQTFVSSEDPVSGTDSVSTSMTESTSSKSVGEVIRSLVQKDGFKMDASHDGDQYKHFVSIGVNTLPKLTFEKETCTPIRHLFSKGTMTFYVSKMDKSTSTLNQARIMTGSNLIKAKSVDKITMTAKADHKDIGTETEPTTMDGKITACISKLRNVSERLNSPPAKKAGELFFGKTFGSSTGANETSERIGSPKAQRSLFLMDEPEERRQKQIKTLLEQTNAALKPKDPSPIRKPQPITTLKCRKPASASSVTEVTSVSPNTLKPEERYYDSKSLPRGFPSDRPGTVRMGSQPLSPSRLPLLRYNSAPGRIATVPAQTLLNKSNQSAAKVCRSASPSKIPITKKMSPPEYVVKPHQADANPQEAVSPKPQMRRPLPSITETRTPSSCSDTSTASGTSAAGSSFAPCRLSTDSSAPNSYRMSTESSIISDPSSPPLSLSNRVSLESSVTSPSRSPSTNTSLSITSDSFSDVVFTKSSNDAAQSVGSTETLEDKNPTDEKSPKKSGIGFMQRFLSKKKKAPEEKKREPVSVIKSGPTMASAVAALASATPPLPTPAPESHALANPQFPPHHYPPPPEHKTPPPPRKPRPFVYVRQRIFSIQQDNVEDAEEKKVKDKLDDPTPEVNKADLACAKEAVRVKDREKTSEKTKEKTKKEEKVKPEKEKKKDGDKDKSKTKTVKVKSKKIVEKGSTGSKKEVTATEANVKT